MALYQLGALKLKNINSLQSEAQNHRSQVLGGPQISLGISAPDAFQDPPRRIFFTAAAAQWR